jgi:hypothetical protein
MQIMILYFKLHLKLTRGWTLSNLTIMKDK